VRYEDLGGIGGTDPVILNLNNRWMCVVSFRCSVNLRMIESQIQCGRKEGEGVYSPYRHSNHGSSVEQHWLQTIMQF